MTALLADRHVYFSNGDEFEGRCFLENGGVWTIAEEDGVRVWRWHPPHLIAVIVRKDGLGDSG